MRYDTQLCACGAHDRVVCAWAGTRGVLGACAVLVRVRTLPCVYNRAIVRLAERKPSSLTCLLTLKSVFSPGVTPLMAPPVSVSSIPVGLSASSVRPCLPRADVAGAGVGAGEGAGSGGSCESSWREGRRR